MKKRNLSLDEYGISAKRYKELCGFCEQYPEWKSELDRYPVLSAVNYDGMPHSVTNNKSDPTGSAATRRFSIEVKMDIIEQAAKDAAGEFWKQMIRNVCYGDPFSYLSTMKGLYESRNTFYRQRRYFFYLLSERRD